MTTNSHCRICNDPRADEINKALASGASLREVARQFIVSLHVLNRHFKECVGGQPRKTNCKTCRHERVEEINTDIQSGKPITQISMKYGISYQSLKNHRRKCLGIYSKLDPALEHGVPWKFRRAKGSPDHLRCRYCGVLCSDAESRSTHERFCNRQPVKAGEGVRYE